MYVFVRTDLSTPQVIVQACHAALEAGREFSVDGTPHLVLLAVPDEQQLLKAASYLAEVEISHILFREPDIGDAATAIATRAVHGVERRLFRKYQCLKEASINA